MTFAQPKLVFRNLGNGKFEDVSSSLGGALMQRWPSRGAAFADYDNDGDMDVAVNNLDNPPSLFRNDGGSQSGHWLSLALKGVKVNRSAIGARVILETEAGRQMQEVQGGSSYQSCNDVRLHFGLGASRIVKSLVVKWPNGQTQSLDKVEANHRYMLQEGGSMEIVRP